MVLLLAVRDRDVECFSSTTVVTKAPCRRSHVNTIRVGCEHLTAVLLVQPSCRYTPFATVAE